MLLSSYAGIVSVLFLCCLKVKATSTAWSNSSLANVPPSPSSTVFCGDCKVVADALLFVWPTEISSFVGATVIITVDTEQRGNKSTSSTITNNLKSWGGDTHILNADPSGQSGYPTPNIQYAGGYQITRSHITVKSGLPECIEFGRDSTGPVYIQRFTTDASSHRCPFCAARMPSEYLSILGLESCTGWPVAASAPQTLTAVSMLTTTVTTYAGGPAFPTTTELNSLPLESVPDSATPTLPTIKPVSEVPSSNLPPSRTTYNRATNPETTPLTHSAATFSGSTTQDIGSITSPLPKSSATARDQSQSRRPVSMPTTTIGDQTITATPSAQYVYQGVTLIAGGSAITVSGTLLSLGESHIVVGTSTAGLANVHQISSAPPTALGSQFSTIKLALSPSLAAITIGGLAITPNSASQYTIGSQTLAPGGVPVTVSGILFSLAPPASALVIGSQPQNLVFPSMSPPPLTIGGVTFSANSALEYLVGTQTLMGGGPAITILGTQISLASSATALILGSSTQTVNPSAAASLMTIAGITITANSASEYLISGQTLSPGAAITVFGTRISLAPSASALVVGSSTRKLFLSEATSLITIVGFTITANSASEYLIGGQTLSPGSAITVSGTRISLAQGASQLVVGSSTRNLGGPTTTSPDLGPAILSGLGGTVGPTASGTVSGSVYAGGADGRPGQSLTLLVIMASLITVFLFG